MVIFHEEGATVYNAKTGVEEHKIAKTKTMQDIDLDATQTLATGKLYFKSQSYRGMEIVS